MPEQSSSGAKGYQMEEALRAYFFEAGYFVVRGLPYQLEGDDVTDVDLWLYERPAATTRRRIIVDIKNKKSPKAAERIIWTKGLQQALGADAAIVATTDRRSSSRKLAKTLGVTLFDGDAIARVTGAKRLNDQQVVHSTEIDEAIKRVDLNRRTSTWRDAIHAARGSILSGMGVHSTNRCLGCFAFFAQEAATAHPGSAQAELAVRLSYLSAALALISLDFVVADHAFRPIEDRRTTIVNAVRYGQAESNPQLGTVKAALQLARKYVPNGAAVARKIELGFTADAERIPAEIIADFVARVSVGDAIFQIARELESASSRRLLPGFDFLSPSAKGALGAFMDFNEIARDGFARSWEKGTVIDATRETSGNSSIGGSTATNPAVTNLPVSASLTTEAKPSSGSKMGPLFEKTKPQDQEKNETASGNGVRDKN